VNQHWSDHEADLVLDNTKNLSSEAAGEVAELLEAVEANADASAHNYQDGSAAEIFSALSQTMAELRSEPFTCKEMNNQDKDDEKKLTEALRDLSRSYSDALNHAGIVWKHFKEITDFLRVDLDEALFPGASRLVAPDAALPAQPHSRETRTVKLENQPEPSPPCTQWPAVSTWCGPTSTPLQEPPELVSLTILSKGPSLESAQSTGTRLSEPKICLSPPLKLSISSRRPPPPSMPPQVLGREMRNAPTGLESSLLCSAT